MPSTLGSLVFLGLLAATLASVSIPRDKKAFALFNVVQFKNDVCQSSSGISGGSRNGTCYTSSECASKSGTASGNCAAGFGVCCVFLQTGTNPTISENRTYLRNPGFPAAYAETSSVTYTINKCASNICQFRLDFESFTTLGPAGAVEASGGLCVDTMTTTLSSTFTVPVICGKNTGQHMYLHVGNGASDNAKITMAFSGASTIRTWEIRVTQIPCTATYRAPTGCMQYYTALSGKISTFNYLETAVKSHLASQRYSACIRQAEDICCVSYFPCEGGATDAFSIDNILTTGKGKHDADCTHDYVLIPGSSHICTTQSLIYHSRYCGDYLGNAQTAGGPHIDVCDCTPPFFVGIVTDNAPEGSDPGGRGVCLDYKQVGC